MEATKLSIRNCSVCKQNFNRDIDRIMYGNPGRTDYIPDENGYVKERIIVCGKCVANGN